MTGGEIVYDGSITTSGNLFGGYSNSGVAASNSVTISDGSIEKNVYCGYSDSGDAVSNSANISGGTVEGYVYGGYVMSGSGEASRNSVTISGGTVDSNVYGGDSYEGTTANNSIIISGGTLKANVFCGASSSGIVASNSVNISGDSTLISGSVYGGYSYHNDATGNSVNMSSGTVNLAVLGGYSKEGTVASNSVKISRGIINDTVYGGCSNYGEVASNSINISGGTVNSNVFGGYSYESNAASNSVKISGDTTQILGNIYGGVASGTGNAYENKVNIATGTLKIVYGGYSESGSVASNSVDISGDTTKINEVYGGYVNSGTGSASYNILNISSGTLNVAYGGYANDSGDANENQVTMTGGEIVYDGSITNSGNLFGGYSELGNAASNSVNISGGTIGYIEDGNVYGGNIYGGWSNLGNVASNSVTISGGTVVGYVYGGHSYSGNAASNSVNISGGTVNESVDGGWSELGNAANNSVNISGGNVKYDVFGGYVNQGTGSASYNLVNISGGTVNQYVYGGWCDSGYAASNSVNISDGTVNGVFGARSESSNTYSNSVNISGGTIGIALGGSSYSDSASNSVNISGGTVEDEVYGGSSDYGVAINNSVNISGNSTSIDCNVYGGYSFSGSVASNSVNISGGTFGSDSKIYAGYVDSSNNSSIKDNGVNISGDVTGLENTEIYGYYFRSGSGTNLGNELHIGRAVDYDDEGKIKRDTDGNIIYKVDENTIWQGKTGDGSVNNKVKQIANFETIALHSVAWSNTLPAIAAESFIYDGNTSLGGNITLDITSLTFAQNNPTGTMTLLQSDTEENFNGIKLKYSDSEAADFIPDSGRIIKSDANKTLQSKGIKFTYDYEQKVSRADSNKKVNFTALNTFKKSELGSMKWSDGGYTFANTDVIDANGLVVSFADNFKVEGAEDKNKGDSLDLLDLSSITGATTNEAIARTKTLTYDKNPTSAASLTLSLSQTDSIETNADKNKVTYTIGTKNVTKATFDKELTWNTSSQPFYDASSDSGYIFSESTVIDAKNLTLSFTDSQKDTLKAEDTMTLISATGISSLNNVDQPDNKTFQLSRTGDLGTKFDGTATGVVLAENSAVKYQISKIETDKITLGSRNWTANAESLPDTWRVKADTVIDANDFSFTSNAVTALASGDTKTLVAGSGIVAGSNIADKTVGIDYIDNSLKLGATAFGKIETITDAVQFKVDSVALDSVDISGWKSTDDVSAVPDVWAANTNGVDITATNFDPELTSGSKTIITATTAAFSDNKIDENIRYKADSFSNDSKNGVTFAGFQEGGVKTTDGGKALTYYAMFNDVTDISLGEMNWGTIRDASAVNYDYANISNGSIDISNLTFTAPENIDAGAVATLLKANNSLEAGENISHSQDFEKAADNGAKFESTLSGSVVRTTAGEIAYKATGTTLNGVDLSQWNSSKEASAVPDGWTANANGVNVTATNFNPTLTTGSKTIITASADMFKDENIDESIRYGINSFENDSENGVTLSGNKTGGVKSSDDGKELKYYAMSKNVTDISLGSMKWGEGRTFNSDGYEFKNLTKIDATELKFTNPEIMSGTMDIVDGTKNLGAGIEVIGGSHKQNFDTALDNKAVVSATLTGEVSVESEKVKYALDGITINSFDLANWDGEKASPVNDSWKLAESATVETDGMSILPGSDEEKQVFILKSDTEGYFANVAINGENAYGKKQNKFTDSDEAGSVVLDIAQEKGVALDNSKTNIIYKLGSKDVTSLKLNSVLFKDGAEFLSRDKYNYSKLTSLDTDAFNITFEKPETITVNQTMTLLKANDTLTDIAAVEKSNAYSYSPVSGVTMDAIILSRLEAKSGKVALTAFSNKADKLTFGDVEWLDKGALIDHKTLLNNVSFDGADVDTTKIAFTNKQKLDADMQMTLVSDFGDSVGTITGDKYKVGTAYEGEGSAYLDGSDLKFKIKTGAGLSDETHTTVMSMDAGIAVLTAGSEQIGTAIEGLGNAANIAPDGTATFAAVGGGSARYKTGSHVDTNSWNIALAVGKNLEKKDGTLEYGLFGEYGRGNYTLHMDGVEDAGSGNSRYTGGGLITKWTNSHNVYTEASFRLGNVKENTSNILHDGAGNGYGYDKKAKYKGGHIGFGKKYREDENTELEIYGKFFYNEREGIYFAAGADQYSLDKVRSRILRAGFRLASTDRKWNRYGGIAYDHEFGGESTGSVNGMAIRSASIKGGTIRGEFGFRREATKTNPWKTDFSLFGFTGKRKGFGGNIAFEYHI
ncbi:MAG: hypothetical protein IKP71_05765 [Candidatus Riflebacteria bacterium]|nr:hypothetical protein [Candidatus Riflebacteria bacterium]